MQTIRDCSMIVGHLEILNLKLENEPQQKSMVLFPNLVEITDYLAIFQVHNVTNLGLLFPELSIIRGNRLIGDYALLVFFSNSLLEINLNNLVSIMHGSVYLRRLYHACYINTVNWNYIIKSEKKIYKPSITLIKDDCFMQKCLPSCASAHSRREQNCWNEHNCQIICNNNACPNNCHLNRPNDCCRNPLCSYCDESERCVGCSKYRDLNSGSCVFECSNGSLIYESHSCVDLKDCSRESSSLIVSYHVLDDRMCVRECPIGYKKEITEVNHNSRTFTISRCSKCKQNVCTRDCPRAFSLKTLSDLDSIKFCVRIKSLHVQLRVNVSQQDLTNSLQYLEEIDDYLVVIRNKHLVSLDFFKRLRTIRGVNLYEKRFALFVHTNEALKELWNYADNKFRLLNGTVKFFENPYLCYEDILNLIHLSNISSSDAEVSFNFNGYRRLTCSNRTIELSFDLKPMKIVIKWNITITDLRRLKGFNLFYVEAPIGSIIQSNDVDFISSSSLPIGAYQEWNQVYFQYDELVSGSLAQSREVKLEIDVKPFTRYAIYVKADITMDTNWNRVPSFESDRLISQINYVYSMPASEYLDLDTIKKKLFLNLIPFIKKEPSPVESLIYEPITFDSVNLKWDPPSKPNGIIQLYFIVYTRLKDIEKFPNVTDACQFSELNLFDIF